MAINPENIDIVKLSELPNGAFALLNYIAQSNPSGIMTKGTQADFAAFIAPYVAAIGSSGYVNITDNTLPNPSSGNRFSFVSAGTYTQDGEADLVATGTFNIIYWDGTIWTLTKAINVDLSDYALKNDLSPIKDSYGKFSLITNGFFNKPITGWVPSVGTIARVNNNMRATSTGVQGLINTVNIPVGKFSIEIKAKVVTRGDGKIGAQLGTDNNKFQDLANDNLFHNYIIDYDVTEAQTQFVVWNQSFSSSQLQVLDIEYVLIYDNTLGLTGQIKTAIPISSADRFVPNSINSTALFEETGGGNLIKGDFSKGFELGGTGTGKWQSSAGSIAQSGIYMRATNTGVQGIINWTTFPKGKYTIEVDAIVITLGDGKIGAQLNEVNKFQNLFLDGQLHTYKFEYDTEQSPRLVIWNQEFASTFTQVLDLKEVRIYESTKGLLGLINNLEDEQIPEYFLPADINHIIDYGQSLSLGATGAAITTTVVSPNILMFKDQPFTPAGDLVPFYHHPTHSETPIGGSATVIAELAASRNKSLSNSQFLVSYAGEGGASIDQLSKGTVPYTRLLNHVTVGMQKAQALGKTYCLYGIQWTQGEADCQTMTKAEYRGKLVQLRNDLIADAKAITNQKWNTAFAMYQLSSFNSKHVPPANYNKDFVTVYEDMGKTEPGFYFGNPNYDKVYTIEDGGNVIIHLNSISYKRMGAEYGIIWDKLMTDKEYKRLTIQNYYFQGKLICLEFNKDLAIDTTTVNAAGNYGFSISANTINSVTIKDNRITIVCANNVVAGTRLLYAFNAADNAGSQDGPRGNIRSTDVYQWTFAKTFDWLAHTQLIL